MFWSRSRQELWRKGETSGEVQRVREAFYDCDGDVVLLFVVDQEGDGRLPHGRALLLLPPLRGLSSARWSRCASVPRGRSSPAWPRRHTRGPGLDRAAGRPRDAGGRVRQGRRRRRPGSCSSRSSTASAGAGSRSSDGRRRPRSCCATAGSRSRAALPADDPDATGASSPRSRRVLAHYRAPRLPDLPPLQSGVVGYLGYDVVREIEHLPAVPPDDRGLPDAVMSVIGSLVAFDHWRQRAYLIESVPVLGLDAESLDAGLRRRRSRRVEALSADLARPLSYAAVAPPDPGEPLPAVRSTMPRRACTSRRSRWPRSTSVPATSSRSCWPSATTSSSTPTRTTCTGCCGR